MRRAALAALALALTAPVATAQDAAQDKGFRVLETREPPRGASHDEMLAQARPRRIETEMVYVTRLEGDLADGAALDFEESSPDTPVREFRGEGSVPTLAIVAILLAGLALWLRFGGSGALLTAAPKSGRPRQAAPDSWALSAADQMADSRSLLDQIAAMPDRRAAMVRLLHHCLLFAGDDSDTQFARADTEREAFRRLPESWRFRQPLAGLLRAAELAHYGGREVDERSFAEALETGRRLLSERRPAHA